MWYALGGRGITGPMFYTKMTNHNRYVRQKQQLLFRLLTVEMNSKGTSNRILQLCILLSIQMEFWTKCVVKGLKSWCITTLLSKHCISWLRIHCMASMITRFESSWFLPMETPRNPYICSSCWQRIGTSPPYCRFLLDYLQLPWHLWSEVAVYDDICRGMH